MRGARTSKQTGRHLGSLGPMQPPYPAALGVAEPHWELPWCQGSGKRDERVGGLGMCLPSSHGEQEEAVETARLPRPPCLSSCPDGERSNCYLGRDTVAQHGSPWPYPGWDLRSEKPAVPWPGRLDMASCRGRLQKAEPCHHSPPGGRQQWC